MTNTSANTDTPINCRMLKGKVVHAAIEITLKNPYSGAEFTSYKALCGKRPPKHSLTYGYHGTKEAVNCGKCLSMRPATEGSHEG